MKAILIDATKRTIDVVQMSNKLEEFYRLLECSTFTIVQLDESHALYCDDEALLKQPPPTLYFEIEGYRHPIAGNGLILDHNDEGDSCDCKITLSEVQSFVTFTERDYYGAERIPPGTTTVHPILGRMAVVGSTPRFSEPRNIMRIRPQN